MEDVLVIHGHRRIDEFIAGPDDLFAKSGGARDRPQLDERQPFKLSGPAAYGKILRKSGQRTGEAARLAVRAQSQIDLKYSLAAGAESFQKSGDKFLEVA